MSPHRTIIGSLYRTVFKPLAFQFDAEFIHNSISSLGEHLEFAAPLVAAVFSYQNPSLKKNVLGVEFENPIGLSAGFDNDGHVAKIMKYVGFGFNTVGTVTAKSSPGNLYPRLGRLPKSQSLLVNKGFKSEGADRIAKRLDGKNLTGHTIGLSVGSTNLPIVNTIPKAIEDYLYTFEVFKEKPYVKYFELNISCPNTAMTESFTDTRNFKKLVREVVSLKIRQPIFVKMPNEIAPADSDALVRIALTSEVRGFIFSNLVKNRKNPVFVKEEMEKFKNYKGNFSGKPTAINANALVAHTRKKFGRDVALIGCGGVFTIDDVIDKLACGADLVQLITGIIFEGPQLIGELTSGMVERNVEIGTPRA
ncbi:MAG TPA: hypothetical protein VMR81_07335 [Patescibacteria group bacterium]|nr:hypothetical protein [Patescibacteria group bacterium]